MIEYKIYQPWSTFLMHVKLSDNHLQDLIELTDNIIADKNAVDYGDKLAGQIDTELEIESDLFMKGEIGNYFRSIYKAYIDELWTQAFPLINKSSPGEIPDKPSQIIIQSSWVVSQKDNEYNPNHIHTNAKLSSVLYLKIPKYLPSRKAKGEYEISGELDACIQFTNVSSSCFQQDTARLLTVQPEAGDFFIFPATQYHQVYPFRTADGKGERRSVSMNVEFGYPEGSPEAEGYFIRPAMVDLGELIEKENSRVGYQKF